MFKPFVSIESPPDEPLDMDASVPAAPPEGFELDESGGERRISWRWISARAVATFVFIALWDAIVGAVLYFVSPASDFVTGQTLYLDGGITTTQ